jgi:hypothetical protein
MVRSQEAGAARFLKSFTRGSMFLAPGILASGIL